MAHVTEYFGIARPVEFLDVHVDRDNQLFLDPSAIRVAAHHGDALGIQADRILRDYFGRVVTAARAGTASGRDLLTNLHEPNETRLGLSAGKPRGNSVADKLGQELWDELRVNKACQHSVLRQLEDLPLFVKYIGNDRVSDMCTRIIFTVLADFTQRMMVKYPNLKKGAVIRDHCVWDESAGDWDSRPYELPFAEGKPLLLVPPTWVFWRTVMYREQFYNRYTADALYREAKSGTTKRILKGDVKRKHPDRLFVNNEKAVQYKVKNGDDLVEKYRKWSAAEFNPLSPAEARNRM